MKAVRLIGIHRLGVAGEHKLVRLRLLLPGGALAAREYARLAMDHADRHGRVFARGSLRAIVVAHVDEGAQRVFYS